MQIIGEAWAAWEVIAGVAAIVSTICITYTETHPLPIHAKRTWGKGGWLSSVILLTASAGMFALVVVLDEWRAVLIARPISLLPLVDLVRLLFRSCLAGYLFMSARMLYEVKPDHI